MYQILRLYSFSLGMLSHIPLQVKTEKLENPGTIHVCFPRDWDPGHTVQPFFLYPKLFTLDDQVGTEVPPMPRHKPENLFTSS